MKQTRIDDENTNELYTVLPNVKKGVPDDRKANIELYNEDNMILMARYPDNYFDLAIVDPPYGMVGNTFTTKDKKFTKGFASARLDKPDSWETKLSLGGRPTQEYWDELFRVSKNQIVFGMQYFTNFLPPTQCVIIWDKMNGDNYFSDAEIAWTSFDLGVRICKIHNPTKNRIHPTQKAEKLYGWIINKYCKEGFKILDTHLGSGSIAIACHKYKVDLVGCEIDEKYFNDAKRRLEIEQAQQSFF